jgi:AcrR family transcriptional regulator
MSPRRTDEFKADRREAILDAAQRLFVAHGYDRTTLRAIAREAGLSTGAIYIYFQTKAEILEAVCRAEWTAEQEAIRRSLAAHPAIGRGERIEGALLTGLARHADLPDAEVRQRERARVLMIYEATREPAFAASVEALLAESRAFALTILREEQASGLVRADVDLDALAEILLALSFGLEVNELLGGRRLDWRAIIRTLAVTLSRGLAQESATAETAPASDPIGH